MTVRDEAVNIGVGGYPVDNAEDYMGVVADILDEPVIVTELLDGYHWAATILRDKRFIYPPVITNHEGELVPDDHGHNPFYAVLYQQGIDYLLDDMVRKVAEANLDIERITLRGEMIGRGIGSNDYRRAGREVRLFDIELNGEALGGEEVFALFTSYAALHVPVLSKPHQTLRSWLNRRSLVEASKGKSRLWPGDRAGIVIRLAVERSHPEIGRVILKQVNPFYL
jgi:hypothetical protein